jgi:hypothetical protein
MKTITMMGVAVLLVLGLVAPAAAETTLTGSVMCAKCTLKKADAAKCQDVLVVKGENGATTEYYIAKNAAADEAGHACSKEYKATVTGEVTEKDGKQWVTASKIVKG